VEIQVTLVVERVVIKQQRQKIGKGKILGTLNPSLKHHHHSRSAGALENLEN
jgi:hypothetical protein